MMINEVTYQPCGPDLLCMTLTGVKSRMSFDSSSIHQFDMRSHLSQKKAEYQQKNPSYTGICTINFLFIIKSRLPFRCLKELYLSTQTTAPFVMTIISGD